MSGVLGYVVVEWDGQDPVLEDVSLYRANSLDRALVLDVARQLNAEAQSRGSGERYTVHAVMAEQIEEGT